MVEDLTGSNSTNEFAFWKKKKNTIDIINEDLYKFITKFLYIIIVYYNKNKNNKSILILQFNEI